MVDLKIIEKKESKILVRTQVTAEAAFTKALPNRDEVKGALAKALKVEEDCIVVAKIDPVNGQRKARVIARIYEKKEDAAKIEAKHIIKRHSKPKKEAK